MATNGAALAKRESTAEVIENVLINGDLATLSDEQRVTYYRQVCQSIGLNELTQPFSYLNLNKKLTLYANKNCTDQLRDIKGVSITRIETQELGDIFVATAYASRGERQDSEIGAVPIKGLGGEFLANAMMKATTKAKRRVTLSICGLGMLDETEIESIPDAQTVVVNKATGEVLETRSAKTEMVHIEDRRFREWFKLCDEALKVHVQYPDLVPPVDLATLRLEYAKLRKAVRDKQAAGSPPAVSDGAADGSRSVSADVVTDKRDPDWVAWLEAKRQARLNGSDIDTSQVKLGIPRDDLKTFIQTLSEAQDEEAF